MVQNIKSLPATLDAHKLGRNDASTREERGRLRQLS